MSNIELFELRVSTVSADTQKMGSKNYGWFLNREVAEKLGEKIGYFGDDGDVIRRLGTVDELGHYYVSTGSHQTRVKVNPHTDPDTARLFSILAKLTYKDIKFLGYEKRARAIGVII